MERIVALPQRNSIDVLRWRRRIGARINKGRSLHHRRSLWRQGRERALHGGARCGLHHRMRSGGLRHGWMIEHAGEIERAHLRRAAGLARPIEILRRKLASKAWPAGRVGVGPIDGGEHVGWMNGAWIKRRRLRNAIAKVRSAARWAPSFAAFQLEWDRGQMAQEAQEALADKNWLSAELEGYR